MAKNAAPTPAQSLRRELGFLTEAEVAAFLNIGVATLRNRQAIGTAPPVYKASRQKLYRADELTAWIHRSRKSQA